MMFTFTNEEMIGELSSKISQVENTYENIKNNEKFKSLLEIVLAAGNYLNGTSARGGAFGFTIDSLSKIADMRGQDGKTTLFDYIISYAEKTKPDILNVAQDFVHLDFVSKFPFSQLGIDLNEVTAKNNLVKKAIESQSVRAADKISEKLSKFHLELAEKIGTLSQRIQILEQKYLELCDLYIINPKDLKPEELCEKFNYFLSTFEATRLKYLKLKDDQEKKSRIEARRQAALQQKQENSMKMANQKVLADEIKNKRIQKEENTSNRGAIKMNQQNLSVGKMMEEIETRRMSIMPNRK